jgi:hypothetical protein
MRVIVEWLGRVWRELEHWIRILSPLRFSFIVVALVAWAFNDSDQGQDTIRYLAETKTSEMWWYLVWVSTLAAVTWYFSRQLLHVRFPKTPPPQPHSWVVTWTPRILGALVFASISKAMFRARGSSAGHSADRLLWWGIAYAILAIVFPLVTAGRRKLLQRSGEESHTTRQDETVRAFPPVSRGVIGLLFAMAIVFFFAATFFTTPVGNFLGAPGVIAIVATMWVATGSGLVYLSDKVLRFPLLVALLIFAVIVSQFNDNHQVRTLGALPQPFVRVPLAQQFAAWQQAGGGGPIFIVATEGGGIRAAYWTTTVLTHLEEQSQKQFSRHLFAISGVSGGSVGVMVYASLVAEGDDHPVQRAGDVLRFDALGPTLASMLQQDLVQRFVPFKLFDDRAQALEQAWEAGWRKTPPHNDNFGAAFSGLFLNHRPGPFPSLFLNGTIVESGERFITSNTKIDSTFTGASDALDQIDLDIPRSTAALLSARFTYVSPAGTIEKRHVIGDCTECYAVCCHDVDGGYFENSGAATAMEIARTLRGQPVYAVIIRHAGDTPLKPETIANEVLSPVRALLATRDARAVIARKELRDAVGADHVFEFDLEPTKPSLPLGWVLSDVTRDLIDKGMASPHNKAEADRLVALIPGGAQ